MSVLVLGSVAGRSLPPHLPDRARFTEPHLLIIVQPRLFPSEAPATLLDPVRGFNTSVPIQVRALDRRSGKAQYQGALTLGPGTLITPLR
jgi:hypothetical protein